MSAGPSDFTEDAYRDALATAKARYRFEPFGSNCDEPHVLWRHDVDFSVHRAVRLAEIEAEAGVASTYFLLFHSTFYNLLELGIADRARRIAALGHDIGLHFDSSFYAALDGAAVPARIASEAALLESIVEVPVRAFSFHNPGTVNDDLAIDDDRVAGLVNAYGRTLRDRYRYVSDANGHWRFTPLAEVLAGNEPRLHVLTHPEWWQAEAMPPRRRVARCARGRADWTLRDYDDLLARAGRQNIG